jgi:hypothetical protein
MEDHEKPECQLIGEDGNVFLIMGRVRRSLEGAGQRKEAAEFTERARAAHSYDEVLRLVMEYVEVT